MATRISGPVLDEVQRMVLNRYGRGPGRSFIPEENRAAAEAESDKLLMQAGAIEEALDVLRANRFAAGLMVAAIVQLHPSELDDILLRFGQAVATKDPTRYDGRYSAGANALAEPFRS